MDLSSISTEDLQALQSGDLSKVSTDGLMRLRGQPSQAPKKVTLGKEGFAQSVREELENYGPASKFAMGVSGMVDDAAMRLKQLTAKSPIGSISKALGFNLDITPEEEQGIVANRVNREGLPGMAGAITGGVAMTGGPAAALQKGLTKLLSSAGGAAPVAAAAGTGATLAATTNPVLPGESEAKNAGYGAIGGAGGQLAMGAIGRVIQPVRPTADAQRLMSEGVTLTPGQSAGANSFIGRMEQSLQSIPVIGDIIRNARGRATEDFNVAAIRRVLPKDQKGEITQAGRQSIDKAHEILDEGYDRVLDRIGKVNYDEQFTSKVSQIVKDPDLSIPQPLRARFNEIISEQFEDRVKDGIVTADVAKKIHSNLGALARRYSGKDGDERALGIALNRARDAWKESFSRSAADPADAAALSALDKNWANLIRVERAAGYQGAAGGARAPGVFTASNLSNAVRAVDSSKNKSQFARGNSLMQDLSDSGRAVLNETVPDSGTTGRALTALGVLGAGAAGNEYSNALPSWVTGMMLTPLLYSRAGSKYASGQLANPALMQALQQATPAATNLGSILGREQSR
jgi:hypothetical protein